MKSTKMVTLFPLCIAYLTMVYVFIMAIIHDSMYYFMVAMYVLICVIALNHITKIALENACQ